MQRILVVEDNANLALGLRMNLEHGGFSTDLAISGEDGLKRVRESRFDLMILDMMLPGGLDGFQVLERLRSGGRTLPVIVVTARTEEADKLRGFQLGADDYVTKPFGILELIARVHAVLRRVTRGSEEAPAETAPLVGGDIELSPLNRTVTRGGERVHLRPKEFDLLHRLMSAPGQVLARRKLLQEVWGYQPGVYSRTLDVHVADLRRKLEDNPENPRHLVTVHSIGYRFDP
ncbi:MAG TPA: response regulator transcription factor [Gemmatimonadales bacterium]|nr:response regulator transcription factor [Gemmatimonadales bacterium]